MERPSLLLVGLLAPISSSSQALRPLFTTSTDPGGCIIEHLAVEEGAHHFQFDGLSPDGRWLSVGWERGEERGMFLLNVETGERRNIPKLNNAASFSPDGTKLVAAIYLENGSTDIVEYDRATEEITPISPDPSSDWLPSYSPDGGTVLYNSFRNDHQSELFAFNKADGFLKRWTERPHYDAHGQFSPDGESVLFLSSQRPNDHDIYMIDVASGDISLLTGQATNDTYGSWSPSGGEIVFASDRAQGEGELDLYIIDLTNRSARQLTSNAHEDNYPFFSRDGRSIYFGSVRDRYYGVYRIRLDSKGRCS